MCLSTLHTYCLSILRYNLNKHQSDDLTMDTYNESV